MAESHRSFYNRYQELAARAQTLPHYRDPAFLEKYAQRYREHLLKSRQAILDEHTAFERDALFVAFLASVAPNLIEWCAWRVKALALAETLDSGLPPESERNRHPRTTEEWQAGIDRKRQKILNKMRVKIDDHRAKVLQNMQLLQEFEAELDSYEIDEDDRDQLIADFKAQLLNTDEDTGQGYRRL